jgi:transcriptional regulator with XRE-family HTH domain
MKSGRERLRDWIDRSKVNQTQAARILGMTPVFLSQILNGDRTPGLANAVKIEDVTGIAVRSWQITDVRDDEEHEPARVSKRQR